MHEIYSPNPNEAGKSVTREGGFLQSIDLFDADFFGIPPREARAMDPQQRILLENCWVALERAGIPPDSLYGTSSGVYIGTMGSDYILGN